MGVKLLTKMPINLYRVIEPRDAKNGDLTPVTYTMTDEQIVAEYWDIWYRKKCIDYGQDFVDTKLTKKDCVRDWVALHNAQKV